MDDALVTLYEAAEAYSPDLLLLLVVLLLVSRAEEEEEVGCFTRLYISRGGLVRVCNMEDRLQ